MARIICIMGESGSGKTTSLRNLDPEHTYIVDALLVREERAVVVAGEVVPGVGAEAPLPPAPPEALLVLSLIHI